MAVLAAIDYLTGYELSFSIFYLIPVGISAWYAGTPAGIAVCLISAATWLVVDHASGHPYSHLAFPFWNAAVRLGFFAISARLLGLLHDALTFQSSLAEHDDLTGIMNGSTFRHRCDAIVRLAARHGHPMTIGYLDLDGFKGVNDRLGHGGGDWVLKEVAAALTGRMRASDIVARLGGDEFAILLPETGAAGARIFFREMRESLVGLSARNHWQVGFSIGVAVFPAAPANSEAAIRRADDLMYRVKNSGKNSILFEEYPGESSGG